MTLALDFGVDAGRSGSTDFGLSLRALAVLRALFASCEPVRRAIVYGSRAKGNFREGSDIDIALDAPALSFDLFLRLNTLIDDLMLPWQVDLSVISHIDNPDLLAHIASVGQVLWQKPVFENNSHARQTHHSLS